MDMLMIGAILALWKVTGAPWPVARLEVAVPHHRLGCSASWAPCGSTGWS